MDIILRQREFDYFLTVYHPKSDRRIPSIRANISAGIYPVTWKPSTRLAVRSTRSHVIRNDIRPSVRKLIGNVRIRAIEPITRFTSANTIATTIAVR